MVNLYQITTLENVKGEQRDRVQERLYAYGGKQIAPDIWKVHLTPEKLEELQQLHARPGHEVVKIELDE